MSIIFPKPRRALESSVAPTLLASTCVAALLLGAPARAGQTITNQTVATVTNPAGQVTTSIVITGSTVTGAVTNAGTIAPGKAGINATTVALAINNSSVGGGVNNSGTIAVTGAQRAFAVLIDSSISGGLVNSGTIDASAGHTAVGINANTIIGDVANSGTINANGNGVAFGLNLGTVSGAVSNNGTITASGGGANSAGAVGIQVIASTGAVANAGQITANAAQNGGALGISVASRAGALSNLGSITVSVVSGNGNSTGISLLALGSVANGIANSGTINVSVANNNARGIFVDAATVGGGISNSGTITATGNGAKGFVDGIVIAQNTTIAGGITNGGSINVTGVNFTRGIESDNSTINGGVGNAGSITVTGKTGLGIFILGSGAHPSSTVSGGVANSGTLTVSAAQQGTGIRVRNSAANGGVGNTGTINVTAGGGFAGGIIVANKSSVVGNIANAGMISATGAQLASGIAVVGRSTVNGAITNTGTIAVASSGGTIACILVNSSASGAIANSGAITANGAKNSIGIDLGSSSGNGAGIPATIGGGIANAGSIAVSDGVIARGISLVAGSTVSGGIANSGKITASSSGGVAIGISLGLTVVGVGGGFATATVSGGVTNSGTITATGGKSGIGIVVHGNTPVSGGITNTGTITGSTAAISLAGETGVANTVTQAGGMLAGSIIGSGNAKSDVFNVTGGTIVLQPTQSISGFGTYNQSGGTLAFNVTQNTGPGTYPTLSAGTINLRGGTFELVPATSSLTALATQHTTVFKNAIVADPPLTGSFANVASANFFFNASLSPDATTANALDATLTLSQTALAASAQDLTQDARLGLDAPRVLTEAIQDRLVANGGALGEWAPTPPSAAAVSKGPVSQPSFSFGNANLWARGADQFGSATASPSSAGVGYDINRAAPLIAGIDWRFDNDLVAGVAATYVATSAKFKDGSSTNVSSYQGAAYAGWAGGPWYALASVVASFNDFGTSRLLTPFGLPGDATSSPSGQSYQGHAEAGYHWLLPAAGVSVSVTPYAALDYVNAYLSGFSETGGFGALSVNAADSNSFQTTLGVRLTSRIATASGTLAPELRLGWSHEFLDASQQIIAALVGVPGSTFTSTGIAFGRDAALIGAGFSLELSPDAKVFVDYDGRLASRVQEHSVSGGLKVRF